jgi:hypothetical protein
LVEIGSIVSEKVFLNDESTVDKAGQWFSPGTPVSSTNKTDLHDIAEILLKVALNTITLIPLYCTCLLNSSQHSQGGLLKWGF